MNRVKEFLKAHIHYRIVYFIRYWRLYPQFGGNHFNCPICGYSFKRFLPFGLKPRPNAQCPVCSSLERHRLHYLFLKRHTNIFSQNLKVLHIAPELCFSNIFSSTNNSLYLTADLMAPSAIKKWDVTNLPAGEGEFDVILCSHVLEHVIDDRKAMRELFRVLKKGGWAILDVPIGNRNKTFEDPSVVTQEDRERVFGQSDHVRIYGRDYVDRLREAGFEVRVDKFISSLSKKDISKYSLLEQDIFYCTKA